MRDSLLFIEPLYILLSVSTIFPSHFECELSVLLRLTSQSAKGADPLYISLPESYLMTVSNTSRHEFRLSEIQRIARYDAVSDK